MTNRPAAGPAALYLAAAVAALFAVLCALLVAGMVARWTAGRPVTTPVELFQDGPPFLVPGQPLPVPWSLEPAPVVTEPLVRAIAAAGIAVFAGGALVWAAATAGLLRRRRWGRLLTLTLFALTTLVGAWNAALLGVLVLLYGTVPGVASAFAGTLAGLVFLPGLAGGLLLGRRVRQATPTAPGRMPVPVGVAALTLHFGAAALLLALAAVAPEFLGASKVLLGPWLVGGWSGRVVMLVLAALHGIAGEACFRRRPPAAPLALWLNLILTVLLAVSALTASNAALAALSGGVLSAGGTRGLLWIAVVLGVILVGTVLALRPALRSPVP